MRIITWSYSITFLIKFKSTPWYVVASRPHKTIILLCILEPKYTHPILLSYFDTSIRVFQIKQFLPIQLYQKDAIINKTVFIQQFGVNVHLFEDFVPVGLGDVN